jgi:hypothetical protein
MSAKGDDFAKDWMARIDLGIKFRDWQAKTNSWEDYRQMYRGEWDEEDPVLNLMYSTYKTILPRTYFRTPTVTVTPRRPEFALHARVVEAVDNWLLRELKVKKQMKRAVHDSWHCGTGVIKLGYDSEYGYIPAQGVDVDGGTITQVGRKDGEKIEYKSFIKSGLPWALRCRPEEIVVPFGYDDPDSLPWVGHLIWRPLSDVQDDIKYIKNKTSLLKGGYIPNSNLIKDSKRPQQFSYKDAEPYVLIYEIRDLKTGRMYCISEDNIILDEIDELQVEGLPYDFIMFNEDPVYFWGVPEAKYVLPQQLEVNEIKKAAYKNRRYNVLKFLYQQGCVTKEALDLLMSDDPNDTGAGISVNSDTLASAILPLMPHNLTADLEKDKQMVLSDNRETVGVSRNNAGEYIPMTSKTATEANLVQQGSDIRIDERRDIVADLLVNIIAKFNQMVFKFWTTERVVEIAGPTGQKNWIQYTGDQLKGEYFLSIDPDSGVPVSKRLRYEQAFKMFESFNNDPLIDQVGLRKIVLNQFEWIDPTATLLSQEPTGGMTPPGQNPLPGMPPMPGGPQGPSGPQQPIPFEQLAKQMQGRIGKRRL